MSREEISKERVVVEELTDAIKLNLDLALLRDEGGVYLDPDWDLIDALQLVCEYYLPYDELKNFNEKINRLKLDVKAKLRKSQTKEH